MRHFPFVRFGSFLLLSSALAGLAGGAGCVRHARQTTTYPSRPPGCALRVINGPVPRGVYYDDIGPVDAGCYLETTRTECMRQLRAEACKMGGDIVYDVPEKPLRPEWREYHYKGTVAHTRPLNQSDIDEGRAPADAKIGSSSSVPGGEGKGETPPAGEPTDAGASSSETVADAAALNESPPNAPVVPLGSPATPDAGAR